MLVLARRIEEELIINNNITVKVIELGRGQVKLGITCDRNIPVYRRELVKTQDQVKTLWGTVPVGDADA